MNRIKEISNKDSIRYLNYAVKLGLFLAFFIAIFFPPEVIAGKGMLARAPIFLASSVIIPVIYYFRKINLFSSNKYPHLADLLIALPFLLDTLGNLFGFYDKYDATDDVLHFFNWLFLIPGIMAFVYSKRSKARDFVLIGAGISAIAIIGWEAFEWLISDAGPLASNTPDALSLTYGDTVGDLVVSFSGGVAGVLIARDKFFKK